MWLKKFSRKSQEKRLSLERRTADIVEKLSRRSWPFRRHSAPPQAGREDADSDSHREVHESAGDPSVLGELPEAVLEMVLSYLTLKDLVAGSAGVNKSWHSMVARDTFWRSRLHGSLPPELRRLFKQGTEGWWKAAAQFYGSNLLEDAAFAPAGFSVAAGPVRGKSLIGRSSWKVHLGCYHTERMTFKGPAKPHSGLQRQGTNVRVLVLTTPTWAAPECVQHVDLVAALKDRGMTYEAAVAFLDTSPELAFSVWCHCGSHLPSTWHRGYAVVMLENGDEASTSMSSGWRGVLEGRQMQCTNARAFWISWAPDETLLQGCKMLPKAFATTERGTFKRLSAVFTGYRPGVRRANILLKGLHPQHVYTRPGKSDAKDKDVKPTTEFFAPQLRFVMPEV